MTSCMYDDRGVMSPMFFLETVQICFMNFIKKYFTLSAVMLVFKKHNGATPADDIAPQIITDCANLTLDFK